MKFRKLAILAVASVLGAASATAANIPPDMRTGTLPGGLTYYILNNDSAEGTADYFFAQRVGSVHEDENQRGLAHFLEHMCFNGTEHFPGNSLIAYLESIGVKFGAHLNAYTSTDETVYNICKAPTRRASTVDSCLLILRDWSCALTLADADIDAERGVIVNEWRQRNSASNRMLERAFPRLYGGSAYGNRLPIGLMSVVENFDPATLRDFYSKWYIPANQAVIVVGDIDADAVEKSIKRLFEPVATRGGRLAELPEVAVADTLTCVVESDPEQGVRMLQLYFRMPGIPAGLDAEIERKVLSDMTSGILAERFADIEASAECPHTSLGVGEVKYLMSRGEQALTMRGTVKAGRENDALATWYGELMRVLQHGISQAEVDKARAELEASLAERKRRHTIADNTALARKAVRHFLDGGHRISEEEYIGAMAKVAASVSPADVERYIRSAAGDAPKGAVIYLTRPKGDVSDNDMQAQLCATFRSTASGSFAPFVQRDYTDALMTALPAPGEITASDSLGRFGAKVYTLSNGIRVVTRRSSAKPDQIFVRGYSPGGISMVYDEADVPTLRVINELMAAMKHGGLSAADMQRVLARNNVKVSTSVSNTEEGLESATNRQGLETAFQALYLRATAFEPDTAAFSNFMDAQRASVTGRRLNPVQIMGDSIHYCIYNRHPLAARQSPADVEAVSMAKAIAIYADRFADMGDFTFMVTGDFDTDSLELMLKRYVASLPTKGRKDTPRDFGYIYTPYSFDSRFSQAMENPQAIVYSFFSGDCPYTLHNMLCATAFGQLLRSRLLADLREDKGWTYSIKTHCAINPGVSAGAGPQMMMPTYIKVTSGREEESLNAVLEAVTALASENDISADELSGIRNYLLKNHDEATADNAYWLKVIKTYLRDGVDLDGGYTKAVEQITPEAVADFARRYILPAHKAALVMSAN
ncbi:MAG: insulinase family protein [Muribaculaceae bacterium]|nr:insulinase family protein [Muribaculaceae bacterium]